jgi:carbamoyl-phosphate synthase large subunit
MVTCPRIEVAMKPLNVLLTAASRRVPLVRAFQSSLRELGLAGRVIVTDVNPMSPAVHIADRWYSVPLANAPAYIDTILDICAAERVELVVPTIDDELVLFGQARERFLSRGIRVAVSPALTSRICNDKYQTSVSLRACGVPVADTFLPGALPAMPVFPLFIKPRSGRGSVGAFSVSNARQLDFFLDYVADPVVQEYLDGPEFTVDVLCDFSGTPLSIVPRERVLIRSGVIDRGRTVRDRGLIDLARAVMRALPFSGAVNIQCRVVAGRPIVFEINPRFSGGIPLTIAAGADFPRMLLQLTRGQRLRPRIGEYRSDLWISNYEESVFLEADAATGRLGLARPAAIAVEEVA